MFDGLSPEKLLVLALIAAAVIGPTRLPDAARRLGATARRLRALLNAGAERAVEELGDGARTIDWQALDPKRYDPRRIIREALETPPSGDIATPHEPTDER